jgi:hypothetical protein
MEKSDELILKEFSKKKTQNANFKLMAICLRPSVVGPWVGGRNPERLYE